MQQDTSYLTYNLAVFPNRKLMFFLPEIPRCRKNIHARFHEESGEVSREKSTEMGNALMEEKNGPKQHENFY